MLRAVVRTALTLICLAGLAPAQAGEAGQPREPAPWDGVERSALISLLGEPTKARKRPDGREVLTYRLVQLGPDSRPLPEQRLVDVPGIGPCATVVPAGDADVRETIEPGVTGERSTTYSKTLEFGETADTARGSEGRRVTLKLTIGSNRRVEDWMVSPKR